MRVDGKSNDDERRHIGNVRAKASQHGRRLNRASRLKSGQGFADCRLVHEALAVVSVACGAKERLRHAGPPVDEQRVPATTPLNVLLIGKTQVLADIIQSTQVTVPGLRVAQPQPAILARLKQICGVGGFEYDIPFQSDLRISNYLEELFDS